jgi:hypothetical protein
MPPGFDRGPARPPGAAAAGQRSNVPEKLHCDAHPEGDVSVLNNGTYVCDVCGARLDPRPRPHS